MAIYYTVCKTDKVIPLLVRNNEGKLIKANTMYQKITKQLYKHRRKRRNDSDNDYVKNELGIYFSHIKLPGNDYYRLVHSVFFCKGNKVKRIWDADINGYRPKSKIITMLSDKSFYYLKV